MRMGRPGAEKMPKGMFWIGKSLPAGTGSQDRSDGSVAEVDMCFIPIWRERKGALRKRSRTSPRAMEKRKGIVIAVIAVHTALLACYTFPSALVPEKLRVLGQLYARPLFHQQWLLFAPDPPVCSCQVQARWGSRPWSSIERAPDSYMQRRVAQAIARQVQAGVGSGVTAIPAVLLPTMLSMALYSEFEPGEGRTLPIVEYRLVEHCITDPARPADRQERITNLRTP